MELMDSEHVFLLDGLSFGLELLRERNESNIVVLSGFAGKMEWKLDDRMVMLKLIYISDVLPVILSVFGEIRYAVV